MALTWNEVAGMKAVGGYRIYRNTSDVWTGALNSFLVAVDTNSYVDDGSVPISPGIPTIFTCTQTQEFPVGESTLIPDARVHMSLNRSKTLE